MGSIDGPLSKVVDVYLDSSVDIEADPLGIVPTASFMVSAALGDALASALMKRRNFTEVDYALTHPAGQLGRNLLLNVHDVMHPINKIALVAPETRISDLVIEMTKFPLGAACIVNTTTLMGIVTDGDLRRSLGKNNDLLKMTVKEIMNKEPQTISPCVSLGEALKKMESGKRQISVLPVTKNTTSKKILGLLRLHDIYTPNMK